MCRRGLAFPVAVGLKTAMPLLSETKDLAGRTGHHVLNRADCCPGTDGQGPCRRSVEGIGGVFVDVGAYEDVHVSRSIQ